jgi:glutamate carboxypeptidase
MEPARADGSMVNTRRGVGRYTIEFKGVPSHSGVAPEKGVSAINELAHWILTLHGLTNYDKGTNLNVGIVKGGTTANTVAEDAIAQVDLRMKEIAEATRVQDTINDLLANPRTPGIKVKVSGGVTRPPMNPSVETLKLCDKVNELAKRLGVDFEWIATGGGSDANITAALGVPSIDGLGPIGSLSHTVDEYLEIASVEPRLKLLIEIIKDIVSQNQMK